MRIRESDPDQGSLTRSGSTLIANGDVLNELQRPLSSGVSKAKVLLVRFMEGIVAISLH